jgi:hypothetical protein
LLGTYTAAGLLGLGFVLLALGVVCAVLENDLWAYFLVPGTGLVLFLLGYIQLSAPRHDLR